MFVRDYKTDCTFQMKFWLYDINLIECSVWCVSFQWKCIRVQFQQVYSFLNASKQTNGFLGINWLAAKQVVCWLEKLLNKLSSTWTNPFHITIYRSHWNHISICVVNKEPPGSHFICRSEKTESDICVFLEERIGIVAAEIAVQGSDFVPSAIFFIFN